jgi:uncharacterized protein
LNRLKSRAIMSLAAIAVVGTSMAQTSAVTPQVPYTEWTTEKEIFVPMRDGINLDTDVLLPKGAKGPLATVLVRTPYDKDNIDWAAMKHWYMLFLQHGYAFVFQNERGRHFSEGTYKHYLEGAATDGYDTIDWITKQPWSNGKVGTFGCSSSGEQQWPMANSKHPAHAAMLPLASGTAIGSIPGNDTQGAVYHGGIPLIGLWAWWYNDMATTERLLLPPNSTQEQRIRLRESFSLMPQTWFYTIEPGKLDLTNPKNDANSLLMQLPSKDVLRRIGGALTPFDDFITWTPGDPRWNEVPLAKAGFSTHTPALHIDTWHDVGAGEMTRLFKYVQDQNTPDQFLIMGAGPHCTFLEGEAGLADLKFGDLEVGDARYRGRDNGFGKLFLDWFDHFLKGENNGVTDMPKVQLDVMGKGWVFGNHWPLETTRFTKYYLAGSQSLSTSAPSGIESDTYLYDPASPVPTRGGGCCSSAMAVDQRDVEMRRDVMSYTTPTLKTPVTVAGPIDVLLYVSSSAKDTDFVVKLIDVYPDGKAINLGDDGFRVRYREGFDKKVLMRPGEVYPIHFTNMVTGNYFPAGHRIRLDVTSSNFPSYERNLNTGGNNYDETTWVTAENSIHHSAAHPSQVILPIIPN